MFRLHSRMTPLLFLGPRHSRWRSKLIVLLPTNSKCIVLISLLLSLVVSGLTAVKSCQPSENRRPPCMYALSIRVCG